MRIAIGCDHNGVGLKQALMPALQEKAYEVHDFGCYDTASVDYPDIAQQVAEAVAQGKCQYGVLICGTGIGMSIAANKIPGVRAALCHDPFSARRAREHNDANVLCMGGSIIGPGLAKEIVEAYLNASFEGGRHARRVNKVAGLERAREKTV
ncbi:MAG: ribose 5-phosphate isomerase B [Chloroflexi bacterium]|nr:ribose 5-phosphate isomerase B [Chloroflexota bacterium]